MNCELLCSIAVVFIFAMIYLKLFTNKNDVINEFKTYLPDELQQKYKDISIERRNIYLYGLLYGTIIGLVLLLIFPIKSNVSKVCLVLAASSIGSVIYYILYPKSDYMILYLDKYEDRKRWLDVYNYMQNNYYIGITIGLVIALVLEFSESLYMLSKKK